MGVIRNFGQVNRSALEDDWIILSSDGEESVPTADIEAPIAHRRRNQRNSKKLPAKPEATFKALGAKGKSHRKFRRFANANLAMTELGNLVDETELETVSIHDFIPHTTSPFALLLQQLDHVQTFNEFINCTEEEQRTLIGQDIELELENCSFTEDPNLECVEFVENSRKCFSRIDSNIRQQLVKKHVPLGLLGSIEANIVQFFNDNPGSMYEANFQCSFKRFLLHACCQYLNLNCQSVDQNGLRLSYVKNKNKKFSKPLQLLSQYLEEVI